jgi:hypothetical protein
MSTNIRKVQVGTAGQCYEAAVSKDGLRVLRRVGDGGVKIGRVCACACMTSESLNTKTNKRLTHSFTSLSPPLPLFPPSHLTSLPNSSPKYISYPSQLSHQITAPQLGTVEYVHLLQMAYLRKPPQRVSGLERNEMSV